VFAEVHGVVTCYRHTPASRLKGRGSVRWTTAEVLVRIPWNETYGPNDGKFKNITSYLEAGGFYALR